MKRLGQLCGAAFLPGKRQMVQNRKMRDLHPLGQHLRQPVPQQLVGGQNLARDNPEDRGHTTVGLQQVPSETGHVLKGVGKVEVTGLLKFAALLLVQNLKQQGPGLLIGQWGIVELFHLAIETKYRRRAGGDMQVTGTLLLHHLEQ